MGLAFIANVYCIATLKDHSWSNERPLDDMRALTKAENKRGRIQVHKMFRTWSTRHLMKIC